MIFEVKEGETLAAIGRNLKAEGINDLLAELMDRGYIRNSVAGTWEVRDVQS